MDEANDHVNHCITNMNHDDNIACIITKNMVAIKHTQHDMAYKQTVL